MTDGIPEDDLKLLIEKWRKRQRDILRQHSRNTPEPDIVHDSGIQTGINICADELEALLDE